MSFGAAAGIASREGSVTGALARRLTAGVELTAMGAIDFHAHLASGDASREPPFLRAMFDPEGYMETQDAAGIELTVLSNALMSDPGDELAQAKAQHEFLADLVANHPNHFAALAGVNPWGGRQWFDEAERCLEGGFAGLVLQSSRDGQYLDAPEVEEFLALADRHSKIVFIHPSDSPVSDLQTGDPILTMWIGRPYDTGISLCRLLMADTLAPFPNLRIVVAHAGGVVPMLLGRLDQVHATRKRAAAFAALRTPEKSPGDGPPARAEASDLNPSERIRRYYLDTAGYHPAAIWAAIAAAGIDHVVLGSDHPPVDQSPQPTINLINQLELSAEDRAMILSENARRLLSEGQGSEHERVTSDNERVRSEEQA